MKTVSVQDLRRNFRRVERLLNRGETIQISRRGKVIARLVPEQGPIRVVMPDFMARLRKIYGKKTLGLSGAELLADDRGLY